ncbi:condensation domain-containing protein [Streptomyces sp. NPDC001262]|uniref:condensation domain-containing protein n=1 Tax=Streptomyces sp. NPDC001262 TaxID=3364552 RepID=UPI0036CA1DE3
MHTDTTAALQEQLLRRARAAARTHHTPTPAESRGDGPAPLSRAQRRLWLTEQLGPESGAQYNVPFATRLHGPLDVDALGTALTGLVHRHEILRTRYGRHDGEPYQEPLPAPAPVTVRLADTDGDGRELLTEEAGWPFDLAAGTVPRALVLRHGPQDHTVMLTFHHISIDGPSLDTIAEELAGLYAAARDGVPCREPLPPQYADFARRESAQAGELGEGLDHWARRLAGAAPLRLPRSADAQARLAADRTAPLDAPVLSALRALGTQHRATLFTVTLAAAFAALHRFTGETDLVIGCAGTHREGRAMRGLVGLCVNTLPVRVDLSGDPAFTVLVERVRDALLDAQQHRDVPFDLILERLGAGARDAEGTALVRVTSDVLREPTALRLPGLRAEAVEVGLTDAKFDLSFGLLDTDRPAALVRHRRSALDEATGEELVRSFAALLGAVAADPGIRLSGLPGRAVERDGDGHPAEALLRAHPEVAEAVVPHPAAEPLLAYAVLRRTDGPSPARLRACLRAGLAPEAVPAAVVLLDAMPRTPRGTVDTARLPGAPAVPALDEPRAAAVTEAFAAVLGQVPGPDDDFFALGGQSLTAVQLAEQLRSGLGLPLNGLDVMQCRTPRAVAALLETRATEQAAVRPSARPRRSRPGTVLVTGGTGGVGSFVLRELAARGRPVLALARPESAHLVAGDGVDVVEGDLSDLDGLRAAVASADAVIHAACTFTRPEVDVAAMEAMTGAWRRGPFVFVSSVDAYGHPADARVAEGAEPGEPLSPYGRAKLDCERLLSEAAVHGDRGGASAVRSPIVWGPHARLRDQLQWGATGILYQAAANGRPIVLPGPGTHGHDWYGAPWVHAAALARAVTACLDDPVHGVANALSGHVAWPELAAELVELLGSNSRVLYGEEVHPDLDHHWHYRADRLADALRPRPGEDLRSVLASMTA